MPLFNEQKLNKLRKIDKFLKAIYPYPKNKKEHFPIVKNDVKEIIVIAFLLIGDTIMYMPAIKVLKKNFPFAKITLVCGSLVRTILQDQDLVDDFIIVNCPWISPFNKSLNNILNLFSSLNKVNRKKYDFAIDFRGDWRNIFYMNFINARRKAGFNFSGGEYMLTDVIALDQKPDHLIDEIFAFLQELDCIFTENDKYPILKLTKADNHYVDKFKKENDLCNKFIIGIHPGASLEERKWDEHKYADLIIRLSQSHSNYIFLIFEGPNEKNTINILENTFTGTNVKYLVVSKSLHEYIILMSICQLVICNDSGAAHLACAYNVPSVVIFGKGDPKAVKPFTLNKLQIVSHSLECKPCHLINCRFGTNLCMKMVNVDEVYEKVISIIENEDKLN